MGKSEILKIQNFENWGQNKKLRKLGRKVKIN